MRRRPWRNGGLVHPKRVKHTVDPDDVLEDLVFADVPEDRVFVEAKIRDLDERDLRPFQIDGCRWLIARDRPRLLLCDEQGTGKSAQALRANMGRALIVVCPASLRLNWRDQAARWSPHVKVLLARPGDVPVPRDDEMVVASMDSLPSSFDARLYRGVRVLFDEAQMLSNPEAARTQNAHALAAVCRSVWVLTGTPMAGTPDDLWSVLELAQLADVAFGSRERFEAAFGGSPLPGGRGLDWPRDPPEADPFIRQALGRVMLRRLRKDRTLPDGTVVPGVLNELPEKVYETIRVEVPEDTIASLAVDADVWAAVKLGKLPPLEMISAMLKALAVSRIPAMLEYVATRDEPLLVFSEHVEPVEALERIPGWGTATGDRATMCERGTGKFTVSATQRGRFRVVKRFQLGELDHIALTGKVGGAGLTLTRSAHVVRVSRSYTPSANEQAEDRTARFGQTADRILVTDFRSDHVLEDRLEEIIAIKSGRIRATVDAAAVRE